LLLKAAVGCAVLRFSCRWDQHPGGLAGLGARSVGRGDAPLQRGVCGPAGRSVEWLDASAGSDRKPGREIQSRTAGLGESGGQGAH